MLPDIKLSRLFEAQKLGFGVLRNCTFDPTQIINNQKMPSQMDVSKDVLFVGVGDGSPDEEV